MCRFINGSPLPRTMFCNAFTMSKSNSSHGLKNSVQGLEEGGVHALISGHMLAAWLWTEATTCACEGVEAEEQVNKMPVAL